MAEDRRDVGLLAVTSADRLNAGWTAAQRARERGLVHARSHIERLLADLPGALRHRHRARRPSGDARLARRGARPSRAAARRRAFRPDRLDRRPLPALRHRRQRHRRRRAGDRARAGRSGICARWVSSIGVRANAPPGGGCHFSGAREPVSLFSVSPRKRGDGAPGGARAVRYAALWRASDVGPPRTHGGHPVTKGRRLRGARGQ